MSEKEMGLHYLDGSFKSDNEIAMDLLDKVDIEIDEEFLPTDVPFEEFHDEATRRARFRQKVEGESRAVEISIPTDRPVAICWLSDVHLGSGGVDYELLKKTAEVIREHPLAYAITGGDITDSLFFDYGEEIMNMQEQWVYMSKLLDFIGGESIIAGVLGNHDEWSRKTGVHNHFKFSDQTKRPLMRGKSYMTLNIGDQPYKIMLAHQFKGYSMYNANHPQARANREVPGADILMSAHTHNPGEQNMYQTDFGGKTRKIVFVNGKTFKNLDAYGKNKGFTPITDHALGANWIILSPDKKMVRIASSTEEMIETMSAYL